MKQEIDGGIYVFYGLDLMLNLHVIGQMTVGKRVHFCREWGTRYLSESREMETEMYSLICNTPSSDYIFS